MITLHACVTGRLLMPARAEIQLTVMSGRGKSYLVLDAAEDPRVARLQVGDDVMVHLLLPERCEIEQAIDDAVRAGIDPVLLV